jgi:pyridoxine kinase
MRNPIPRVAAIHDLSGFGSASLTTVIPVLSTMGMQVCPLPTALLSSQTAGFDDFVFFDLTAQMKAVIEHWKRLKIDFQAIYSGFLGSEDQIEVVLDFIDFFGDEETLVLVDPVLGDDGETYATFGPGMVEQMRRLIGKANIITPNYTEAVLLLNETYREKVNQSRIKEYLVRLSEMGPEQVVMTSVPTDTLPRMSTVVAYDRSDGRFWKVDCTYLPAFYPGTGDIFASVVAGSLLQGDSLPIALDRAVQFVSAAIRATFGYRLPNREGVLLERVLPNLGAPVVAMSYELFE